MLRSTILFGFCLASCCTASAQVVINEFLYNPASGDAEWVELYNTGDAEVNLKDWILHDATSARNPMSSADLVLPPSGFLVVAGNRSVGPRYALDTSIVIEMSRFPSLNNGGDDIVLLRPDQRTEDAVSYGPNWSPEKGRSVERRRYDALSSDPGSWEASRSVLGATPGQRNSIAPENHDLGILALVSEDGDLVATILNTGLLEASGGEAALYTAVDGRIDQHLGTALLPPLAPGDQTEASFSMHARTGSWSLACVLLWDSDSVRSNDSLFAAVQISVPAGTLRLNEVMYEPLGGDAEWVEYVNTSNATVGVAGFGIEIDDTHTLCSSRPAYVPPGGYVVIAEDEEFLQAVALRIPDACRVLAGSSFALRNSGASIALRDGYGACIDSAAYDPSWHRPPGTDSRGRSLERLNAAFDAFNPQHWSSCIAADGSTPGLRNSVSIESSRGNLISSLLIHPNPFSPDGDGHEDFCLISYTMPRGGMRARLRIFDGAGRLERTLVNNQGIGVSGEIVWDGRDSQGRTARVGMYPALLEALDENDNSVFSAKGVIVVARRL